MIQFFFKVKRRIAVSFRGLKTGWFLLEKRALYRERCQIDKTIRLGDHFSLVFDISASTVKIGRNFQVRNGCAIRSEGNGKLVIGDNNFFNNHCSINCLKEITIGDNNQFGENVRIYDANHQFRDPSKLISEQGYSEGKISIGSNCWISSNVIILKDVTIGDYVVIGANCIIHRSIPSHSLVMNKQELEIRTL